MHEKVDFKTHSMLFEEGDLNYRRIYENRINSKNANSHFDILIKNGFVLEKGYEDWTRGNQLLYFLTEHAKEYLAKLEDTQTCVDSHFYHKNYDSKGRFCSYWHQIEEIISHEPKSILEIGIGNGFVTNYLKRNEFNIVSLDLNRKLYPDIAASVLNIPFCDEIFNIVACYEVLEHLPFEYFVKALSEMYRVSTSHVMLSLPDATRAYRILIQLPRLGLLIKLVQIPQLKKAIHHFNGEHYWEIGKYGYSLKKIVKTINEVGFKIVNTYRVFEMPYHRFFILKKTSNHNLI